MSRLFLATGVVWLFSASISVASPALTSTVSGGNPDFQTDSSHGLSFASPPDQSANNGSTYVPPNNGGPDNTQGSGTR